MADVVTLGSRCQQQRIVGSIDRCRAARTRSTAIGSYRGDVGSTVASSIDRRKARCDALCDALGYVLGLNLPDMKSALTGRSTAAVTLAM